jgi:predicted nucleotidyltransferase
MTEYFNTNDTTWCCVAKKVRKEPKNKVITNNHMSFQELSEIIVKCLTPYNASIIACYIYGSRARGTNRTDSDADIVLFWKIVPDLYDLYDIRTTIENALGFTIDLVSCVRTAKNVHHYNLCDIAYFENVAIDARQIIGTTISIMNLFESSYKMIPLRRN